MEGNIFALYSFKSPSKSTLRETRKLNVCNPTDGAPSSSRVDGLKRDFRVKRIKEETYDCDSKLVSDPEKKPSLVSLLLETNGNDLHAVGYSPEQVEECCNLEGLRHPEPVGLNDVKEETEDEFCPSKSSTHDVSSLYFSGRRKLSPKFGEDFLKKSEDIEDCIPDSIRLSPVEKKTTDLRTKKGMKTNCSSSTVPPRCWQRILEEIRKMRVDRDAPVDLLGPEQLVDRSKDAETQKFHILVAATLSSQTRDATTAAAMKRLHALPGGLTAERVAEDDLSVGDLEQILKPVGFYRQKAKYLKTIATMLTRPPYCGSIPSTLSELMKFPGVGPKIGLVVLWAAFGKSEEGFICDSNVRRVCCRLGWVPEDSTPAETRQVLEKWLPRDLWADICKPLGPLCEICKINPLCPSAFKCGPKSTKRKS